MANGDFLKKFSIEVKVNSMHKKIWGKYHGGY
jgi:hypothetical protein